jgi:integrase
MSRQPITKEASGRYVVVVDVAASGEKRRQLRRRFGTYKEARAWLSETRQQLSTGSFVRPQRMTLAEWVEAWLPILRTQVRRQTYNSYERNLRLHILPAIGGKRLQALKPADLTALYAQQLTSGRVDHLAGTALSHRSVAYHATILGKCLAAAVDSELLVSNPARRAAVPKPGSTASGHKKVRSWPRDDLRRFLDLAREQRNYPAWLLLATTGLRRGEVLGLSWGALDLDKATLSVTRTLVDLDGDQPVWNQPVWSDPKTVRGRRGISLDPATVAVLRTVRTQQLQERLLVGAAYVDHDLVFAWPDGRPYHPERFSRSFVRLVKRWGLPPLSVHGLRHTWATLALQSGVHPKVVQERLGHSSIAVTMDIYSHVLPAMETDAAERVASLILGNQPS